MTTAREPNDPLGLDWLGVCRRALAGVRAALRPYPTTAERATETGRGEGGDIALVIDRAAEDAVLAELESLGLPLTVISEERGEVALAGGGDTRVVVDPVDGSLNAKRGLALACLSIAVAKGESMDDVFFGYVGELEGPGEWWAREGKGAFRGDTALPALAPGPLELLGVETARPAAVARAAAAIGSLEARRIRALGSVAATLCLVADGRLDAMVSLGPIRSVDAAAGQLILREAGGAVSFPEEGARAALDLEMRTRVLAARDAALLERLEGTFTGED
jgi:myo-inositol-1(or 4)-monophosphatase